MKKIFTRPYSDAEVLAFSNGEVTEPWPINGDVLEYTSGGLYDPKIFGGQGSIPILGDDEKIDLQSVDDAVPPAFFGHIQLPVRVVTDDHKHEVCSLLNLSEDRYLQLQRCEVYAEIKERMLPRFIVAKEYDRMKLAGELDPSAQYLTGGEALYRMMALLNGADHPEEWCAFKVLPVAPVYMRRAAVDQVRGVYTTFTNLTELYEGILRRALHLRAFMELGAPDVIIRGEPKKLTGQVNDLFGTLKALRNELIEKDGSRRAICDLSAALRQDVYDGEKPRKPAPEERLNDIAPYAKMTQTAVLQRTNGEVETLMIRDVLKDLRHRAGDAGTASCGANSGAEKAKFEAQETACDSIYEQIRDKALEGEPVELVEDKLTGYRLI